MPKIKLSKTQESILRLMTEGFELGSWSGFNSSVSLQKGGVAKGGENVKVTINTFISLRDKKLIEACPALPKQHYALTIYKVSEEGLKLIS